jgi:pilus assembly protein Flp/PilA
MLKLFRALARDRRGATAIEYGLIVSLVVVAMLVALTLTGSRTGLMWNMVSNRIVSGV